MSYLKSLFFNFLIVFFANHILPGIQVANQTKLPHLGADLPFAAALGLANSLIYPILKLAKAPVSILRMALIACVLNFVAYASLAILPIGIHLESIQGYFAGSFIVSFGSFLTNFLEMKHVEMKQAEENHKPPEPPLPE